MKHEIVNFIFVIISLLASCQESATVRGNLDVFITVKTEAGQPIPLAPVYIAESIGTSEPTLTEKMNADTHGIVHINGSYCFPVAIVTNGGGVVFQIENEKSDEIIYVRNDMKPTVKESYGEIPTDIDRMRSKIEFKKCRLPPP